VADSFDSPWKEVLETFFPQFMAFFFPAAHAEIDWSKPWKSLDQELQRIVRDAKLGRRLADKLIRVVLRDGRKLVILIHIEVQGDYDKNFEKRMFVYNYRFFDR